MPQDERIPAGSRYFQVTVECRRDPVGEAVPAQFKLGEGLVEVAEILDRWLAHDHRYFKIGAKSGATYILRHDIASDLWEVVVFHAS